MLVLSREEWQSVIIRTPSGDTVKVICLPRKKGKTRLGFEAIRDIAIMREEEDLRMTAHVTDIDQEEMHIARVDR